MPYIFFHLPGLLKVWYELVISTGNKLVVKPSLYESGLNDYLGSSIIIIIDESEFYDESFDTSREYFEPLESAVSKEQMEYLPKIGKDYQEDEIAVFLFTGNWNFITSFYRPKDDLPGADEF